MFRRSRMVACEPTLASHAARAPWSNRPTTPEAAARATAATQCRAKPNRDDRVFATRTSRFGSFRPGSRVQRRSPPLGMALAPPSEGSRGDNRVASASAALRTADLRPSLAAFGRPGVSAGGGADGELPGVLGEPGEEALVMEALQGHGRPRAGPHPADELLPARIAATRPSPGGPGSTRESRPPSAP
jgi:hypothetical protein